jgi:FkbM family methyltransferase
VKIEFLKYIESGFRSARDDLIFRPLARSHRIKRYVHSDYDLVVQSFDDHKIAFDPQDKVVGHHVEKFGDWFRDDFQRVLALLTQAGQSTRGKIFLDVGANIGTQTVYALVRNDFARAIAIEPAPKNLMALKTNIAINDFADCVTVVPKAAGEAPGIMQMSMDSDNSGGHSFRSGTSTGSKSNLTVEVTTIDITLADLAIHPSDIGLLWLDVEGYEPEALAGAQQIIASRVPICVEFNSDIYGAAVTAALIDQLRKAGYSTATAINHPDLPERTFPLNAIEADYFPGDFLFI